jgi:heptosyltransferase I
VKEEFLRPAVTNPQRLLIIKPSSLGDVATALPLLCDLKKCFPKAQIDWMIDPALTDLIKGHDAIGEVIPFDRRQIAGWWINPRAMQALCQLIGMLRRNRYDAVIDAQGLLRSALLAWLSSAPMRIGVADAREGAPFFYTHRVNISREKESAVLRMRSLQTPIGSIEGPAEFRMPVNTKALAAVKQMIATEKSLAAIIPGSRWPAKCWSENGFIQIGRNLLMENMGVMILGSAQERELCEQVRSQIGAEAINLAGQTSLSEMIAAISLAKIVIGNDSGPLHVAAALGRPLVGLYGPTDPASVGPYGQMDHVLHFEQAGDYRNNEMTDRSSTLQSLPAQKVWEKVKDVLEQNH